MPTETVFATDIIQAALTDNAGSPAASMAHHVMAALEAAGVIVINPQDMAWGDCVDNIETGVHQISTSLCVWCLEYDPE